MAKMPKTSRKPSQEELERALLEEQVMKIMGDAPRDPSGRNRRAVTRDVDAELGMDAADIGYDYEEMPPVAGRPRRPGQDISGISRRGVRARGSVQRDQDAAWDAMSPEEQEAELNAMQKAIAAENATGDVDDEIIPGTDSGEEARMWDIIDEHDPSEFSKYDGKTAFETLELEASPKLEKFWDSLPPTERLKIVEEIAASAGMASDEQIMEAVGRAPLTSNRDRSMQDEVEMDVLRNMGVK